MTKKEKVFMAFAKGNASTEAVEKTNYMGVAPVYVLGVNPTKEELCKIYNTSNIDKEPEYISEVEIVKGSPKVKQCRVEFIVSTNLPGKDNNPINMITRVPFFITDSVYRGQASGKIQIIDKYGQTAWATEEDIKEKRIPMYKNGPANIDNQYRPAYRGEENLIKFIKTYLNIPNIRVYKNNEWVKHENPEECEVYLEQIPEYFKGNISELKDIPTLYPENKIKCMFGVKTTEKGEYQTVFPSEFLLNSSNNYKVFTKALEEKVAAGALSTSEFSIQELAPYSATATKFEETPKVDNPFTQGIMESDSPWG